MAAVSTIVAVTALAVSVAGTVGSAVAAKQQADFQSEVAQQQATRAQQVADANASDFRRKVSRAIATTRAGKGELQGSQLLSMEDFVSEAEVDAQNIRQGGQVQSSRLLEQASLFRAGGKGAVTGGAIRAGSQLLTGFSGMNFGGSGVDDSANTFNEGEA